jgi:hypothetical protein
MAKNSAKNLKRTFFAVESKKLIYEIQNQEFF